MTATAVWLAREVFARYPVCDLAVWTNYVQLFEHISLPKVKGQFAVRREPQLAPRGLVLRCACSPFQRVDKKCRNVEAGLVSDFLKAGRTGDIDLSNRITNHIKPNE